MSEGQISTLIMASIFASVGIWFIAFAVIRIENILREKTDDSGER